MTATSYPERARWVRGPSLSRQNEFCYRLMRGDRQLAVVDHHSDGGWWWYGYGKSSALRCIRKPEDAMREAWDYARRIGAMLP